MREAPFSPNREQHRNRPFDYSDWRWLNCRTCMRDFGSGLAFSDDAAYCLDRYSSIEFHGRPGYAGRR